MTIGRTLVRNLPQKLARTWQHWRLYSVSLTAPSLCTKGGNKSSSYARVTALKCYSDNATLRFCVIASFLLIVVIASDSFRNKLMGAVIAPESYRSGKAGAVIASERYRSERPPKQ